MEASRTRSGKDEVPTELCKIRDRDINTYQFWHTAGVKCHFSTGNTVSRKLRFYNKERKSTEETKMTAN